jgi:hypothetical protein
MFEGKLLERAARAVTDPRQGHWLRRYAQFLEKELGDAHSIKRAKEWRRRARDLENRQHWDEI